MSIPKNKLQISYNLGIVLMKEGRIYVAYIPALDLSSHGDSFEDAAQSVVDAAQALFEELVRMGTLEGVLLNLGWQKKRKTSKKTRQKLTGGFSLIPPEVLLGQRLVNVTCRA